jgi:hypothetical protein
LAAFTDDEIDQNWPIWDLFQNGGVVLFHSRDLLDEATGQLKSSGFRVHVVDCQMHMEEEPILKAIVDSLRIPRYANMTLDGFNDFVSQIAFDDYTGVIVILVGFHHLQAACPERASHILDILADKHRSHLLMGNRLLTIVQSDDPRMDEKIGVIGGYKPMWNSSEWLNKDRGL